MKKHNVFLKRRNFLLVGGITTGISLYLASQYSQSLSIFRKIIALEKRNFKVNGSTPLRIRAVSKNLLFGAAVQSAQIDKDLSFASAVSRECNIIVPEGELKWRILRPQPGIFNFDPADKLLAFAQAHQMQMRGHTLVSHVALPSWLKNSLNSSNVREILEDHIVTTVKHYAGKIHSWDVVNEAIEPNDGRSDGLRNSLWLNLLGENYIDFAFRLAAKADPNTLLVYNDYGLEYDSYFGWNKRQLVLDLLQKLKSKGTPIHALGIQSHLCRAKSKLTPELFSKFLQDVADLGLKIMITELDVTDGKISTKVKERDFIVASAYEDYLAIALEQPAVTAILTWGLSDRYTWLASRGNRTPARPLPLDRRLERKLAWNAIARQLDSTFKRKTSSRLNKG